MNRIWIIHRWFLFKFFSNHLFERRRLHIIYTHWVLVYLTLDVQFDAMGF